MRAVVLAAIAAAAQAATPFITASATKIPHLGNVTVKWGGLTAAQAADAFIGLYAAGAPVHRIDAMDYPATAPWTATNAIKYLELRDVNQTSGSGSWTFELINMYTDVTFWLFTGGIDYPYWQAQSQNITFLNPNAPLRGHLGPTGNPTEMRVTWNSPVQSDSPTVQYGTSSGVYTSSAAAVSSTYTIDDMSGAPANTPFGWFDPKFWQSAVMTGLQPATTYFYRYGSVANGWSDEFSFTALPATGAHTPLNMLIWADQGMTEYDGSQDHWAEPSAWSTAQHLIDLASSGDYQIGVLPGDTSYSTGLESKWFLFDERMSMLGRQIPMAVGHGNHERDVPNTGASAYYWNITDSGGEAGVAVSTRYPMPWAGPVSNGGNPNNGTWFVLAQGPVTLVMLNSELPVGPTSPQYAFLEATLSAVDRTVTPWVIVAFHRPMYYSGILDPNFAQFEALLFNNQVDLVLTGHVHNAQVTCPIYQNSCVSAAGPGAYDAPIHAVIGNAGQTLTPLVTPTPAGINFQDAYFGYSTLHINSATSLTMNLYEDDTNALRYSFNITRNYPRSA